MNQGCRKTGFVWRTNPVEAHEFVNLLTNIDGYKEMTEEQIENIINNHIENYEDVLRFYEFNTDWLQLTLSI